MKTTAKAKAAKPAGGVPDFRDDMLAEQGERIAALLAETVRLRDELLRPPADPSVAAAAERRAAHLVAHAERRREISRYLADTAQRQFGLLTDRVKQLEERNRDLEAAAEGPVSPAVRDAELWETRRALAWTEADLQRAWVRQKQWEEIVRTAMGYEAPDHAEKMCLLLTETRQRMDAAEDKARTLEAADPEPADAEAAAVGAVPAAECAERLRFAVRRIVVLHKETLALRREVWRLESARGTP